ncbi:EAL domain-containing protein [Microvirga sp. 3-52]|uniref:bifunctional diguanylate cyclase/phosphodiesterase n=1 Tax=Microvirga sp. 3-52 TaxID=2792425 RepID=UPI001ACBB4A9|nr:EAL domain-containing protein [Microvirga sp. 3-52]MBO1906562.1 EAL domain-containing protein [Microvirga sp. 3-52]MBS7453841.1 EAL domain-containing protein [Microvirga sp. 3-52]
MSPPVTESGLPRWTESDRLATLRTYEILDTEPEAAFDNLAKIAAHVCDAPIAFISLVDEKRQWFKCEIGLNGLQQTPREMAICAHAILQSDVFVVPDTTNDPRFAGNPLVTGDLHVRFYAGAPLVTDEGLPLGTLCILDNTPRPSGLTPFQTETLVALAGTVVDHLKFRRINKVLEQHKRELITLTNALPQMIWSACPDKRSDHKNRRWYEFTGMEPGSAGANHWADLIHPEDREQVAALWRHSLQTGEPYECRYRQRHHSGEYRWILSRGNPVFDDEQQVRRWYGTNTDIHEWKKAEEALVESENRYRALIEASTALVWRAGPDGSIIHGSPQWKALTGQEPERSEGHGWLEAVHPDDRDQVTAVWHQARADCQLLLNEFRLGNSSGEYRWVRARGVPLLNADGSVREWVGTLADVHDRKQAEDRLRASEERLRLAIEATSLGIWDIDLVTGERQWTPEARKILGIAADSPITSETFLPCVHPDDRDRVKKWFARRSPNGARTYQDHFRIIPPGAGEERWIAALGRDALDENDQPIRKIGTVQDITERKRAEAELAEKAALLEAILEHMDQGLIMADAVDRVTVYNRRALNLLDLPSEFMEDGPLVQEVKAVQKRMGDIAPEDNELLKSAQTGGFLSDPSIYERTRKNGTVLEIRTVPLPDGGAVRTYTDITARREAEGALRASEERLRLAFQAGRMFAWEQDLITNHVTRSQHTVEWLGIGSGPISEFVERFHPDDQHLREQFLDRILESGSGTMEFRYMLPGGKALWLGTRGERAGRNRVIGVTFDITDRKLAEEEIWRIANHDPLTGLPNRMLAQKRLEQGLADAKQHGTSFSLLVIDLDDFKDVNDSFGHDAGDALLKETAVRLSAVARDGDTVARLGGDEFVVLLAGSSLELAATLAEGITKKLSQPVSYAGQMIASRASIGVAAFPDHAAEAADLAKDADLALYRAKIEGRNRVVTFSPEMRAATEQRTALRREMREAVTLDQIKPFYQPKVCLSTGEIVGFEALARWEHPIRGLLTPANFGDIFDDPELATLVGKRLIGKVASDMRRWLNKGLGFGHVAINLSHVEFIQPGLAEDILRILDLAKVSPTHFEIEITEKVLLDVQTDAVSSSLEKFRARGVQIALDDFGTGYASLTHLKQFPVDHIKVDRSFVQDIEEDPDDEAIVTAVVGLGRSLNLKVTAEGVETLGQAQRLREMGCANGQGYLYAKPMAAAQVPDFLGGWSARLVPAKRLIVVEG